MGTGRNVGRIGCRVSPTECEDAKAIRKRKIHIYEGTCWEYIHKFRRDSFVFRGEYNILETHNANQSA